MVAAREAAARMVEVARSQPVALVFGNETYGLTAAEVGKCQLLATIPADPEYSSLNVAAAVQVLAYELRLAALGATVRSSSGKPPEHATHEEIERFYEQLERSLLAAGFLNPAQSEEADGAAAAAVRPHATRAGRGQHPARRDQDAGHAQEASVRKQ